MIKNLWALTQEEKDQLAQTMYESCSYLNALLSAQCDAKIYELNNGPFNPDFTWLHNKEDKSV